MFLFNDYKCKEYLLDIVHLTDYGHSIKTTYFINFLKKITL